MTTHGFNVRVYRNGRVYSRFFSDSKWGGESAAFENAREYRDDFSAALESLPRHTNRQRKVLRHVRNQSGHIGIRRIEKKGVGDRLYAHYAVSWQTRSGNRRSTTVSINKYGEDVALARALEIREQRHHRQC